MTTIRASGGDRSKNIRVHLRFSLRPLGDDQLHAAGISPTLIRLSTGIEHIDDLVDDLERALQTRATGRLTQTNVRPDDSRAQKAGH